MKVGLLFASPMSFTTTAATGFVPTEMRTGSTMSGGLPAFELQASTIFRSRNPTVSIIGFLVADQTAIRV